MKKDKLYTVNKWNRPLFAKGVDRENNNIFDGEDESRIVSANNDKYGYPDYSYVSPYNNNSRIGYADYVSLLAPTNYSFPKYNFISTQGTPLLSSGMPSLTSQNTTWMTKPSFMSTLGQQKLNFTQAPQYVNWTNSESARNAINGLSSLITNPYKGSDTEKLAKGMSKETPKWQQAAGAAAGLLGGLATKAISGGYSTGGVGEGVASLGNAAGDILMASGVAAPIGLGVKLVSGLAGGVINRGWGVKRNDKNIASIKANTGQLRTSGNQLASATTNEAFMDAAANMGSASGFKGGDLVKGGWFSGGKAAREANRYLNAEKQALAYQTHAMAQGAKNVDKIQDDNVMANFAAEGGWLNNSGMGALEYGLALDLLGAKNRQNQVKDRIPSNPFGALAISPFNGYAEGGGIEIKHPGRLTELKKRTGKTEAELWAEGKPDVRKMITFARNARKWQKAYGGFLDAADNLFALGGDVQMHGGDYTTGSTHIDEGGTHEENPYQGVQVGVDPEGTPNLVEEGELIYNDYVYSQRIELDDEAKEKFHFSKKQDITYADAAKKLEKEISERPNDPLSKAAFKSQMQDLAEEQERQKAEMQAEEAREQFESLSPEDQVAVMQNAEAQEQQAAEEEAMMQEQAAQEQAMQEQAAMQGQPTEEQMMQEQMMAQQQGMMPQQPMGMEPQMGGYAYGGLMGNQYGLGGEVNLFDGSESSQLNRAFRRAQQDNRTGFEKIFGVNEFSRFLNDPIDYVAGDQIQSIINKLSKLTEPQLRKFFNTEAGQYIAQAVTRVGDFLNTGYQGQKAIAGNPAQRRAAQAAAKGAKYVYNAAKRSVQASKQIARGQGQIRGQQPQFQGTQPTTSFAEVNGANLNPLNINNPAVSTGRGTTDWLRLDAAADAAASRVPLQQRAGQAVKDAWNTASGRVAQGARNAGDRFYDWANSDAAARFGLGTAIGGTGIAAGLVGEGYGWDSSERLAEQLGNMSTVQQPAQQSAGQQPTPAQVPAKAVTDTTAQRKVSSQRVDTTAQKKQQPLKNTQTSNNIASEALKWINKNHPNINNKKEIASAMGRYLSKNGSNMYVDGKPVFREGHYAAIYDKIIKGQDNILSKSNAAFWSSGIGKRHKDHFKYLTEELGMDKETAFNIAMPNYEDYASVDKGPKQKEAFKKERDAAYRELVVNNPSSKGQQRISTKAVNQSANIGSTKGWSQNNTAQQIFSYLKGVLTPEQYERVRTSKKAKEAIAAHIRSGKSAEQFINDYNKRIAAKKGQPSVNDAVVAASEASNTLSLSASDLQDVPAGTYNDTGNISYDTSSYAPTNGTASGGYYRAPATAQPKMPSMPPIVQVNNGGQPMYINTATMEVVPPEQVAAIQQQAITAQAATQPAEQSVTVTPYDENTLGNALSRAIGVNTKDDLVEWLKKNNVNGADKWDTNTDFNEGTWLQIKNDPNFLNALAEKDSTLADALRKGYDYGKYKPTYDKLTFDNDRGNWDNQTVQGWWGSEDPAWQEVIKTHPELTQDTKWTREQLAEALRNTDAFKRGTQWLQSDENNRLKYLQAIIENTKAPKKAREYALNYIDENGNWKDKAARDYNTIFNNPSGRAANPGTYWKTPIEAIRDRETINMIKNSKGEWVQALNNVKGDDWKEINRYSWDSADPDKGYEYIYWNTPEQIAAEAQAKSDAAKKDGAKDVDKTKAREVAPIIHSEWPRYAGLMGPVVGLGMMAAGIGKPNLNDYDAALDIVNKGGSFASYMPIGNYLKYQPMDIWANQNRMDANSRATDRAILNNASPVGTRNAGLVANSYASQLGSGELYKNALQYNDNLMQNVGTFNRATDMFNAEAFNRTSATNAEIRNRDRQLRAQLGMQTAAEKAAANAGWYNSLYGNVSGLFKGISDLGRENAQRNMISKLAAAGAFGTLTPENAVGAGLVQWKDEADKKKKRNWLSIFG